MNKTTFIPVIAAVTVAIIAGGAYLFFVRGVRFGISGGTASTTDAVIVSPTPLSGTIDPSQLDAPVPVPDGYVAYTNTKYGFSFYHSPEAKVTEYDEGRGAETIVLENFQKVRGMQIFIVPYQGTSISDQRFHDDVPSGVRNNIQNTQVDGVQAVTFTSKDQLLGDTREVWFIHGGYLFEVTTFQGVTNWFTPIMQSWKFSE